MWRECQRPPVHIYTRSLHHWALAGCRYAILFLASDEAAGITGVNLPVDNGFSIKGLE